MFCDWGRKRCYKGCAAWSRRRRKSMPRPAENYRRRQNQKKSLGLPKNALAKNKKLPVLAHSNIALKPGALRKIAVFILFEDFDSFWWIRNKFWNPAIVFITNVVLNSFNRTEYAMRFLWILESYPVRTLIFQISCFVVATIADFFWKCKSYWIRMSFFAIFLNRTRYECCFWRIPKIVLATNVVFSNS